MKLQIPRIWEDFSKHLCKLWSTNWNITVIISPNNNTLIKPTQGKHAIGRATEAVKSYVATNRTQLCTSSWPKLKLKKKQKNITDEVENEQLQGGKPYKLLRVH